jgi:hypothetical protein
MRCTNPLLIQHLTCSPQNPASSHKSLKEPYPLLFAHHQECRQAGDGNGPRLVVISRRTRGICKLHIKGLFQRGYDDLGGERVDAYTSEENLPLWACQKLSPMLVASGAYS